MGAKLEWHHVQGTCYSQLYYYVLTFRDRHEPVHWDMDDHSEMHLVAYHLISTLNYAMIGCLLHPPPPPAYADDDGVLVEGEDYDWDLDDVEAIPHVGNQGSFANPIIID